MLSRVTGTRTGVQCSGEPSLLEKGQHARERGGGVAGGDHDVACPRTDLVVFEGVSVGQELDQGVLDLGNLVLGLHLRAAELEHELAGDGSGVQRRDHGRF